ncbi:MAG TPA: hypothetical protein VFP35_00270 [Candidatus Saccharimonadales bacterium]|nr:hypothetical protein [Candidatus Saccharimonadales bacterium]
MKTAWVKRLPRLAVIALLVGVYGLPAYADSSTRPYFKVYGGNVVSGGWFESGGSCDSDSSSNYQDSSFSNSSIPADSRNGGILAYANQASGNSADSGGGASSQYAAFALGSIDGNNSGNGYGFYSAGAMAGNNLTAKNLLSFANNSGSYPWGGVFELGTGGSGVRQGNCIPDYYSKLPSTAVVTSSALKANTTASDSGSYSVTEPGSGIFNLTGGNNITIGAGAKVTYFVKGNVYIGHNITYGLDKDTDVPKFSLIVKGSIYIDPGVTRLDGFYSAQPAVSGSSAINTDTGVIWTCHPDNTDAVSYTYPAQNCHSRLVINGAVSAKQVNFLRTLGDVGSASTAEDKEASGCAAAAVAGNASSDSSCNNVAEIINYTPEMIMGGSFFATSGGSSTSAGLPVDSILSLPPAF